MKMNSKQFDALMRDIPTVAKLRRRLKLVLDAADKAKRPTRRPLLKGDKVRVIAGPERGNVGKIIALDIDQRGLRVARVILDTEFGLTVKWLFNADIRRAA